MANRTNTHYAGSCCEWCDDLAQGRAVGNIPPQGMLNGQPCADWMCSNPAYCNNRVGGGYGNQGRPALTGAPIEQNNFNGWHGADGVTLSEHSTRDSRFPGWQESFGAGTFLGNDDFPNDDASHIAIDDGYSATLREHGPSDSRYPGLETTFQGPTSLNLSDEGYRDTLSEMTISEEPVVPPVIPDPIIPIIPDPIPTNTGDNGGATTTTIGNGTTSTAGVGGESNTMMYIIGAAVVGLLAWYVIKNKK